MLFTSARPFIVAWPHELAEASRGSSFAEYSRPNCNAGWNGALTPIKRTGLRPNRFSPNFIFIKLLYKAYVTFNYYVSMKVTKSTSVKPATKYGECT